MQTSDFHSDIFIPLKSIKSKQVTFTHKKAQMTFTHEKAQMTFTHKKSRKRQTSNFHS